MEPNSPSPSTASLVWQKSKWIIKGCIIGVLALLLLVPLFYVKGLIAEREERQQEAVAEISNKWAGRQHIAGPVIAIPYTFTETDNAGKAIIRKHTAWFLPDELNVVTDITPREKHRGIFKVMLYSSKTKVSGRFAGLALDKLQLDPANLLWNEAFVKVVLADTRGLNDPVKLRWKDKEFELSAQSGNGAREGMTAPLPVSGANDFLDASFSFTVDLNGSEQLMFSPLGKTTSVKINSGWQDPSFNGGMLPQQTTVNDSGFTATWKSMAHNRRFPQQWTNDAYDLDYSFSEPQAPPREMSTAATEVRYSGNASVKPADPVSAAAFGVNLFVPVNGYQKTMRTIKYALLCIVLTFAAFFLIETLHKKPVHPFHYGLVGLALVLFYTLLLSFSEYTGFNTAYIIAALATTGLITIFVKSLLQASRPAVILSVVLMLVYTYVFSLLQLQDYALIFGSVGLFLMLAVVMYFSRKLSW